VRDARVRCKLEALENGYAVHVHGCFGEVVKGFCQVCEKKVSDDAVVDPWAGFRDYQRDVTALLSRIDALEEQIATAEDASRRPDPEQERLRKQYIRDQGPDHYDEVMESVEKSRRNPK
jgi:hypothetical protein